MNICVFFFWIGCLQVVLFNGHNHVNKTQDTKLLSQQVRNLLTEVTVVMFSAGLLLCRVTSLSGSGWVKSVGFRSGVHLNLIQVQISLESLI